VRPVVLTLAVVCVLGGIASRGVGGGVAVLGGLVLLVGVGALVTGRARWAFIASRGVAAGVLGAGLVLALIGGQTATPTALAESSDDSATAAEPAPSATPTSTSMADPEAEAEAGDAVAVDAETVEGSTTGTAIDPATGLLGDEATAAAVDAAEPTSALAALAVVEVRGRAPRTGYDRDLFGSGWVDTDRNGCDTRNDVLARDLTGETFTPGTRDCVVATGTLADPYSGRTIAFVRGQGTSDAVQIDHVVALSDAWQKGAQGMDPATRTAFANDPLNLLAVDGPLNQQKGDGDAATWLPPNRDHRCSYVARQVAVKVRYGLWMTEAERNAIATVLSACPGEPLPDGVVADVPVRPAPAPSPAPAPAPAPAPRPAPAPAPAPRPAPAPAPVPAPPPPAPSGPYFANCSAARAAGAAPVHVGEPGYGRHLDRDGDGIGCE
jgi:hypothetical protein